MYVLELTVKFEKTKNTSVHKVISLTYFIISYLHLNISTYIGIYVSIQAIT